MQDSVLKELISSLSWERKEIYKRLEILDLKKNKTNKDKQTIENLENELEEVKGRIKRFENAIVSKLEE